jgi:hypothetical protein
LQSAEGAESAKKDNFGLTNASQKALPECRGQWWCGPGGSVSIPVGLEAFGAYEMEMVAENRTEATCELGVRRMYSPRSLLRRRDKKTRKGLESAQGAECGGRLLPFEEGLPEGFA